MAEFSVVACAKCGAQRRPKPEYAGRFGKCPSCGSAVMIPSAPEAIRTLIQTTAGPREQRTVLVDKELRTQLIALAGVLAVLLFFGRDWLSSIPGRTIQGTSTSSGAGETRRALPPASVRGSKSVSKTESSPEKLPLEMTPSDGTTSSAADIEGILPPVQAIVSRHEVPLDCPSATGVRAVAFLPDGELAMTVHETARGGALRQWRGATGAPLGQPVLLPASNEYQLTFSPNGSRLAIILSPAEQGLMLLNSKTGVTLRTRSTNRLAYLSAPAWCGDGSVIYGTPLGTVEQWLIVPDAAGLSLSQGQPVTRVAISEAGYLLSGDTTGEVRLWNVADGRYAASYRALKAPIRVLETRRSGDGAAVLVGGGEPGEAWTVHVFDLATQKTVHSLTFSGPIVSLAVAPDWRRIVTGRRDGLVTVWDTESRTIVLCPHLERHMWLKPGREGRRLRCGNRACRKPILISDALIRVPVTSALGVSNVS